jgi:hypothetical protein
MIRARGVVLVDAIQHRFQISPGDHGVDEFVAASVAEIGFLKSQAQKAIRVVGQSQVNGEKFPGDGARL